MARGYENVFGKHAEAKNVRVGGGSDGLCNKVLTRLDQGNEARSDRRQDADGLMIGRKRQWEADGCRIKHLLWMYSSKIFSATLLLEREQRSNVECWEEEEVYGADVFCWCASRSRNSVANASDSGSGILEIELGFCTPFSISVSRYMEFVWCKGASQRTLV